MSEDNSIKRQGMWYVFVGVSSALIEFVLFQFLYSLAVVSIAPANIAAVLIATVYNFVMSRTVTFKSTANPVRSILLYLLLFLVNLAFSTWAIGFMVNIGIPSALAKLSTQIAIATWNFFLYRMVIFR